VFGGSVAPVILKLLPEIDTAVMTSGAVPDEVRVTDLVSDVFGWTAPKLRLAGLIVRPGVPAVIGTTLPPDFCTCAHPEIASEQRMKASSPARLARRRQEMEIWVGEPSAKERKKEGARQHSNIKTPQDRLHTRPRFALARLFAATASELTHETVVERSQKRCPIIYVYRQLLGRPCSWSHFFRLYMTLVPNRV
jgi:hypothetical protein